MIDVAIQKIMSEFPFETLAQRMVEEKWRWANPEGGKSFPNTDRLKRRAEMLLNDLKATSYVSTGGFTARHHCHPERLVLEFGKGTKTVWFSATALLTGVQS